MGDVLFIAKSFGGWHGVALWGPASACLSTFSPAASLPCCHATLRIPLEVLNCGSKSYLSGRRARSWNPFLYNRELRSLGCFGLLGGGPMSLSRLTAETRGGNCELTFESTVESRFRLIAHFRCDLCHRVTG